MAETENIRGALLTIVLVFMFIVNFFGALINLIFNTTIISVYPNAPSWIFYIYGLLSLANLAFVISLFMWKIWAFYALCGSIIIGYIMNVTILGLGIFPATFGLAAPIIILYLTMRSRWDLFE